MQGNGGDNDDGMTQLESTALDLSSPPDQASLEYIMNKSRCASMLPIARRITTKELRVCNCPFIVFIIIIDSPHQRLNSMCLPRIVLVLLFQNIV